MRLAACAVVLAACAGRVVGPQLESGNVGSTMPRAKDAGALPSARLVATLGEKAIGPYLAMNESGGLITYLATEGSARKLVTLPLDASGVPTADVRTIATVPIDSGTLVVERAAQSWVTAWTALTDRGEAIFAVGVGADGKALGAPVELARTTDDIVWIKIVPTATGAIALWAEETQRSGANVLAVALDASAKPRGVPSHAARSVGGWQALPATTGAVLAVLSPDLSWIRLDDDGHTTGTPVAIGPAGKDMDVVRGPDGYVAAWTDRSRAEPGVRAITIDESGKAQGARDLTLGRGPGTLTALAGGPSGVMIAWEEARAKNSARRIHTDVLKAGHVSSGATVIVQNGPHPELVARRDGFVLLGWSRLCAEQADAAACLASPFSASAIALDGRGAIVSAETLPAAEVSPPAFAWNLNCVQGGCAVLEASAEPKTRVFFATIFTRASNMKVAATPAPAPDAPEITSLDTLTSGAAPIDVAAAQLGADWLVASLTANDDGQTATVTLRAPSGASLVVSKRALPVGGVAIAANRDAALVAWVTRDAGDPQVHVTKVDRAAKKLGELQLTTAKGDASDVAIGALGDAFVVAWVDGRDGNGEVYSARMGVDLARPAREERLTTAPGDATDLVMLATADRAWLAWADARESPKDGFADVWLVSVGSDAKAKTSEQRVLPTAAHSRSPALCRSADGVAVAWIEEAPAGADSKTTQSYGAMLALVDAHGKRAGDVQRVTTAGEGFATGIWLDPRSSDKVRGVLSRATADDLELDAFEAGARSIVSWPLLMMDGPPTLDVPLAFAGDALLFGDDGTSASDRRLRRTIVRWKR